MPYIGNQPSESFTSFATQEFSTSATTSYTLDHAVTNENEIALFINNVRQQPGSGKAYTATGTALTLSEATASTDTMYCVFLGRALQTVTPATNSINNAMVSSSAAIATSKLGAGAIAQVVQVVKTDTASTSSSFADTGLSASITPSSSSSKVLVLCTLGGVSGANTSFKGKLVRGSTDIFVGDSASNRPQASASGQTSNNYNIQQLVMNFLDSPSTTSSTTYKAQFGSNGSVTVYLNRTSRDNDGSAEDARSASSIILMEVLA